MRTRDLVGFGPRVVFRHSLVCSVVCHGTQQRRIHRALADAGDAGQYPDRVAWHWGWLRAGLMTRWRHGWSRRLGGRTRARRVAGHGHVRGPGRWARGGWAPPRPAAGRRRPWGGPVGPVVRARAVLGP